jgi:large subunit ribosomal protein L23
LFSVKVTGVNTLVQRGKAKRMGRALAKRPNWKKAIVTLREGDDIQFFDETSDSKEQE